MRLDTRACAIASGFLASGLVFFITLAALLAGGDAATPFVARTFLFGYSVSVGGAFIGAMWAYVYGFVLGAAFAFLYNITMVPPPPPPFDWDAEPTPEGE